jgi:large subunit ribosomal protein L17
MRHLKTGRALGVKPAHRRAMLRNLVTSLIEEGRIKTTLARAKELRRPLDRMITLGKQGDLAARRQALSFVKSKKGMANLFGELAERYADRAGGYSRILHMGPRRGDGAQMALVILVGGEEDPFAESARPRRKSGARKAKPVIEEVAEEVQAEKKAPAAKGRKAAAAPEAKAERKTEASDKEDGATKAPARRSKKPKEEATSDKEGASEPAE